MSQKGLRLCSLGGGKEDWARPRGGSCMFPLVDCKFLRLSFLDELEISLFERDKGELVLLLLKHRKWFFATDSGLNKKDGSHAGMHSDDDTAPYSL